MIVRFISQESGSGTRLRWLGTLKRSMVQITKSRGKTQQGRPVDGV
jgi:hypothetical protein